MRSLLALILVKLAMRLDGEIVIAAFWNGLERMNTEGAGTAEAMLADARREHEERVVH